MAGSVASGTPCINCLTCYFALYCCQFFQTKFKSECVHSFERYVTVSSSVNTGLCYQINCTVSETTVCEYYIIWLCLLGIHVSLKCIKHCNLCELYISLVLEKNMLRTDFVFIFCQFRILLLNHRIYFTQTLHYKSEGRGFDSRWCHLNFSLT